MGPIWLLRMARWVRRPPSVRQVVLVFVVIALCLAVVGFEWLFGWPEALTLNPGGAPRLRP